MCSSDLSRTLKRLTTLGTHNPLGHGSNQVHRSSTHTWHLWAFPTSTHRLSEPSSLTFGVIRFSETSLTTSLLILTHNSQRNPYLDSITRLIPTVEVSVYQECTLRLVPRRLSQRRVESLSSPLAVLGQPARHWEVFPSLLEPTHGCPSQSNRTYPSPEVSSLCKTPSLNYRLLKSNKERSKWQTIQYSPLFPLKRLLNHHPERLFSPSSPRLRICVIHWLWMAIGPKGFMSGTWVGTVRELLRDLRQYQPLVY